MSSAEQANPQGLSRPLVIVCGLLTLLGAFAFVAGITGEHRKPHGEPITSISFTSEALRRGPWYWPASLRSSVRNGPAQ